MLERGEVRGELMGDWYVGDLESQGMAGDEVGDLFAAMNGIGENYRLKPKRRREDRRDIERSSVEGKVGGLTAWNAEHLGGQSECKE